MADWKGATAKRDTFSPFTGRRWPERPDEGQHMRGQNERRNGQALRQRQSDNLVERILWSELRDRRLNGFKFVRQHGIGLYTADFACRERNLVIEVDGSQHAGSVRDIERDRSMDANGWSVIRVWHVDVLRHRRAVLETILAALDGRLETKMISSDMKFLPASPDLEANR